MSQMKLKKPNIPKDLIPGDTKGNREKLIRANTNPRSRVPSKEYLENYDRIFRK